MDIKRIYDRLIEVIDRDNIREKEIMSKHTSFKIGGPVDIMILPKTVAEVKHAIKVFKEEEVKYYVMGNGSNLLVADKGIRGAIIKIGDNFNKVDVEDEKITAQAGVLLSALANVALKSSLKTFEFASGIPGTLGGAVTMNAGAYGGEMKDVVTGASVIDKFGNVVYLNNEELGFEYRNSNVQKEGYIVLEVDIQLEKGIYEEIQNTIKDLTKKRTTKQPLSLPSAGSTFKRPPDHFAGKLIQDAGLKGVKVGGAQVSELHSGFIVNVDNATAKDVLDLIRLVQKTVKDKFGVCLNPEVKIIGEID
ncbi:UDP-N-acetylmuramate dehydrogenase [Anaeromicrobium sediminis]|uniref:UDP-N-acetylenolpyruvoylglucosamine reductase n=1 Tax=Anaeromicrobium sediminis TaxID=1478221 RepID=A0A267MGU7_9FIRM|nr:UDP-N-acetylmuramate dehydrogenase [Anaeromicrobium sediminis]PAB58138.1 UDP-N-acetylenolpyruvoylglucosamine reductase [Anaeromicrobium sediminis]